MTDETAYPPQTSLAPPLRLTSLEGRELHDFDLSPDAALRARIAEHLGIDQLRKFRFSGSVRPSGARDWRIEAHLGATVVQPCVLTLAPVTTRIDAPMIRHLIADLQEPEGLEVEMHPDETREPLGTQIDLSQIALEALALSLPDFPRCEGARLDPDAALRAAPPGQTPLDDDAMKPFSGLAELRDKLSGGKS